MKYLTNRIISFILAFAMISTFITPAFATSNVYENESDDYESIEEVIWDIVNNLPAEAKGKTLSVIASDPNLLEYYIEEIDPSAETSLFHYSTVGLCNVATQSSDPVSNIERRLSGLGVPNAVIVAAVAVAASLLLAAADGPLPFGDAYALFQSAKFAVVLGENWDIVAPLMGTIIIIFQEEIGNAAKDIYSVLQQVKSDAKDSADKAKEKKDSKELEKVKKRVPDKLKDDKGNVDLSKFDKKVKDGHGGYGYEESVTGNKWVIQKDRGANSGCGGHQSEYKLKSHSEFVSGRGRTATLGEHGEILRG